MLKQALRQFKIMLLGCFLKSQVQITKAFDQERRVIKTQLNKDEKELRDAAKFALESGDEQGYREKTLAADKVQQKALIFDGISSAIYGPNSNGATGYVAKAVSPQVAFRIGEVYKKNEARNSFDNADRPEVGGPEHLLAHALLGAAVSYATGNDIVTGGLGASAGEGTALLLSKYIYKVEDPSELTAEQKDTISTITTLAGVAIGASTGEVTDAVNAGETAKVAVEDNSEKYGPPMESREVTLKRTAKRLYPDNGYAQLQYIRGVNSSANSSLVEEAKGFGDTILHPINTAKSTIQFFSSPIDNSKAVYATAEDWYKLKENARKNDPYLYGVMSAQEGAKVFFGVITIPIGGSAFNAIKASNLMGSKSSVGNQVNRNGYEPDNDLLSNKPSGRQEYVPIPSNFDQIILKHNTQVGIKGKNSTIAGAHLQEAFLESLDRLGARQVGPKVSDSRFPGIYEYRYQMPVMDRAGNITNDFKRTQTKTVYDPSVISNSQVVSMSNRAANKAMDSYRSNPTNRIQTVNVDGYIFNVTFDSRTGMPNNAFLTLPNR